MRFVRVSSALLFSLGTAVGLTLWGSPGCQPPESRKVLPTKVEVQRPRSPAEEEADVPASTSAEILSYLERTIAAMTQEKPALLKQARRSRVRAKGTMLLPDDNGQLVRRGAERDMAADWPDRIRLHYQTQPPSSLRMTFLYVQGRLWLTRNQITQAATEAAVIDEAPTDTLAQHWLPLLFVLQEPGVVAFDLRMAQGQPPRDRLRVKIPDRPLYSLSFDSQSRLLHQVEYRYQPLGAGRPISREWTFEKHQSFAGLLLPTQMTYAERWDSPPVREVKMEWQVERWEFPQEFPKELFEPPQETQTP
jgi:hypothetical protein